MVKIVNFESKYAHALSEIILDNMYTINIVDHGKEVIDRIAQHFTESEIKKNFPKRERCFVALKNNEVVGTASIAKFRGDETGKKFIVLTVFVKRNLHHQGIGTTLMQKVETAAKEIGCRELVIPASVYGCEFYRKFGFDYLNGVKEQNEDKEYWLVKYY